MTRTTPFYDDDGVAVPAVTTEEMREIDRVAVEEVGLELRQMMENAGRTLAGLVRTLTDGRVVIVAGDGGNGGGGLCAARHLANHGQEVRVVLDRPADELTGAAATQYRVLRGTDARLVETDETPVTEPETTLVVDAVIGYGLAGEPRGAAKDRIDACNAASAPVVSLDVPAGVDATTGDATTAVDADHVLTLALPKTGLVDDGLWLADIGIPREVYRRVGIDYTQPFSGRARVRLHRP